MEFYYSGAGSSLNQQIDPNKSLGGFISSTRIPKGRVNNLFNDISQFSMNNKKTETKAIFLKNTLETDVENVTIFSTSNEDSLFDLEVASVKIINNNIEKISSSGDLPYYGDFYPINVEYASSLMAIQNSLIVRNTITILGMSIVVDSTNIPTFINKIKTTFDNNPIYEIELIPAVTPELVTKYGVIINTLVNPVIVSTYNTTNLFIIKYRIPGVYTHTPEFTSSINNIVAQPFLGGIDNSQLIATKIKKGEFIALWLKKTIKSDTKSFEADDDLFKKFVESNYQQINTEKTISNLTINLDYTESEL